MDHNNNVLDKTVKGTFNHKTSRDGGFFKGSTSQHQKNNYSLMDVSTHGDNTVLSKIVDNQKAKI